MLLAILLTILFLVYTIGLFFLLTKISNLPPRPLCDEDLGLGSAFGIAMSLWVFMLCGLVSVWSGL